MYNRLSTTARIYSCGGCPVRDWQIFVFSLFFFSYSLTNVWGTLTLRHLKRCYGLCSVSYVGYDLSLKINKRGVNLLLKGSYCFGLVLSSSPLCSFKQFWPCGWSPSLSSYMLLQHVMKYVFIWAGLSAWRMNRKQRSLLSCDCDKRWRKELGTLSLSAHLGRCLFLCFFKLTVVVPPSHYYGKQNMSYFFQL